MELATGIGLRSPHYKHILTEKPTVGWFENISENYMVEGGRALEVLDRIMDQYRVVQHGVGLYPGNAKGIDREYLKKLKRLIRRTGTPWISDHLCWGSVDGSMSHDPLPVPFTFEALKKTAENLRMVQDFLEIPLAVENVSSYGEFNGDEMTEWQFLLRSRRESRYRHPSRREQHLRFRDQQRLRSHRVRQLTLQPHVFLLKLPVPADLCAEWEHFRKCESAETRLAIWRGADGWHTRSRLHATEHELLRRLQSGGKIEDLFAEPTEPKPTPGEVSDWFASWQSRGWIVPLHHAVIEKFPLQEKGGLDFGGVDKTGSQAMAMEET